MPLPGVKVGPLDPDATADFGQVSQHNSARTLIRLHAQLHPRELRQMLRRKLDPARTKGLDLDEVRGYVSGLKHDNGDPIVPQGAYVVGAAVRGEPDQPQVLCFTYRLAKSKRSGKWFAPYDAKSLPDSFTAGSEYARVTEMKDRGIVEFDREGLHTQVLQREAAELRRQNVELRSSLDAGARTAKGEQPDEVPGDTRPATQIVADNEDLGRQNEELKARVAQLETHFQVTGQTPPVTPADASDEDEPTATQDPPLEDYDAKRADELVKLLRDPKTSDEQRQAVLDYERGHQNRRSVIGAAEQSLGRGD